MTEVISSLFELCFASIGAVLQFDDVLKVFLVYVLGIVSVGFFIAFFGVGISDRRMKK